MVNFVRLGNILNICLLFQISDNSLIFFNKIVFNCFTILFLLRKDTLDNNLRVLYFKISFPFLFGVQFSESLTPSYALSMVLNFLQVISCARNSVFKGSFFFEVSTTISFRIDVSMFCFVFPRYEFFNDLYHRFLLTPKINMKCMCLQAMTIVYGRCYDEIGRFNDTRYIVGMLERCTDKQERDRLILFLNKLILHRVSGSVVSINSRFGVIFCSCSCSILFCCRFLQRQIYRRHWLVGIKNSSSLDRNIKSPVAIFSETLLNFLALCCSMFFKPSPIFLEN